MMSVLNSFVTKPTVVVVGSSGGIGSAFIQRLAADSNVGSLVGLSRTPATYAPMADRVQRGQLDLASEESIESAAAEVAAIGPLDMVIVATGILHGDNLAPEKSLRDLRAENLQHLFNINTIGPILVAKYFLPLMRKEAKTVFAALSARVGSINDNRLGGWASYRASKSALNMLLKTASIEHKRRFPNSIVAALHPGTVDTRLSKPFSSRVPSDRLFTPKQSAGYLLNVVDSLSPEQTGGFFAWDGREVDY